MNHSTFSGTGTRIGQPRNLNIHFSRKHKNAESSEATCREKAIHIKIMYPTKALAMLKKNSLQFDKQWQ